jgi:hypothetical protein
MKKAELPSLVFVVRPSRQANDGNRHEPQASSAFRTAIVDAIFQQQLLPPSAISLKRPATRFARSTGSAAALAHSPFPTRLRLGRRRRVALRRPPLETPALRGLRQFI